MVIGHRVYIAGLLLSTKPLVKYTTVLAVKTHDLAKIELIIFKFDYFIIETL